MQVLKSMICGAHSLVQSLAQAWLCSTGTLSDPFWGWQGSAQAGTIAVCMWPCSGGLGTSLFSASWPQRWGASSGAVWTDIRMGPENVCAFKACISQGKSLGMFPLRVLNEFLRTPYQPGWWIPVLKSFVMHSTHLSSPWSLSNNSPGIKSGKTTTELLKSLRSPTDFSWMT